MDKQAQPKPPSLVPPGTYIYAGDPGFSDMACSLKEGDELWVGDVLCVRRGDEAVAVNTCAKLGHILDLPNVYLFKPKPRLRVPDGFALLSESGRPGFNADDMRDMISELSLFKHSELHKAWHYVFGDDPGELVRVGPSVLGFEPFRQYPMFCAAGVSDISTQGIIMKKQSILGMADALLKKDGLLEYEEVNGMVHKFATVGGLVSHLRSLIASCRTAMKMDEAAHKKKVDIMQTSLDTECVEHEETLAELKAAQDAVATIGSNALDKLRSGLTEELAPEWVSLGAPINLKTFDDRSKYIAAHGVDPCDDEITDMAKYVARLKLLKPGQYVYLDGMLQRVTEDDSPSGFPSCRPIHGGQKVCVVFISSARILFVKDALQKVSAPVPPTPKTHTQDPRLPARDQVWYQRGDCGWG